MILPRVDARWRPQRQPRVLLLIVVVTHLALLLGWNAHLATRRAAPAGSPEVLSWLLLPTTPPTAPPVRTAAPTTAPTVPPRPAAAPRREPAQPTTLVTPPRQDPPANAALTSERPAAPAPQAAAAPTPPNPASGPTGSTLMSGEATRRAIRETARQPLLSERAALATAQPFHRGAERLADAASAAGKGDCLQGDYAGGGMGLLSLPFLAAAAARGQCAR